MSLLLGELFSWLADSFLVVSSYDRSAAVDTHSLLSDHMSASSFLGMTPVRPTLTVSF